MAKIYAPYLSEDSKPSHFDEIKPDQSKSNGGQIHVQVVQYYWYDLIIYKI